MWYRRRWSVLWCVCGICLAAAWSSASEAAEKPLGPRIREQLDRAIEDARVAESRARFLADHHAKVGAGLFDAGRFEDAKLEFEKALHSDRSNEQAQSYLRRTEGLLGIKHGLWADVVEQERNRASVGRGLALAEVESRFRAAEADFSAGNYEKAVAGFERVREIVKWLDPYTDVSQWKARTEVYLERAEKANAEKLEQDEQRKRDEAVRIHNMLESERQQFLRNRIDLLLEQARRCDGRCEFDKARELFLEVLKLDPENAEARRGAERAQKAAIEARSAQIAKQRDVSTAMGWNLVNEASIPQAGAKTYQALWYDIGKWYEQVLRRQPVGRLSGEEEDWKKAIRTKLEQQVSFDFVDVPLEDVVQFLTHLTDLTIVLDPKAVDRADPKPITLKVSEMPLSKGLDWILRLADLKYVLRDNAVFITDPVNAQGEEIRQLYDVIDLTLRIRDFKGDLRYLRTRTGTSISGGNGGEIEPFEERDKSEKEDDLFTGQKLADFIKVTIAGHTWAVEKGE